MGTVVAVGVDVGFGYTKAYTVINGEERKVKFPTWVSLANKGVYSEVESIHHGTKELWVGEDAKFSTNRIEISTIDDLSEYFGVFKEKAIRLLGLKGKNIKVVAGLPPKYYFVGGYKEKLISENTFITWQGFGVLIDTNTLNLLRISSGESVIIIDVGFNSIDYLVSVLYKDTFKNISANTILDLGILKAIEIFRNLLPSELSGIIKGWSKQRLVEAFDRGQVVIEGEKIDVSTYKTQSISQYSEILLNRLRTEVGNDLLLNEAVVFAGGGANVLKDFLRAQRKDIIIPPEPEFSNARGYYYSAEEFLGDG